MKNEVGQQLHEAIFFIDEEASSIVHEMLYHDFEALLEGDLAILEFSESTQNAVYIQLNADFKIVACVFFTIVFSEEGHIQGKWHLPFQQLTSGAGKGPDLGGGPIKLTSSSQCSVPWHQAKLWEPEDSCDIFVTLQACAVANRLGFIFNDPPPSSNQHQTAVQNQQVDLHDRAMASDHYANELPSVSMSEPLPQQQASDFTDPVKLNTYDSPFEVQVRDDSLYGQPSNAMPPNIPLPANIPMQTAPGYMPPAPFDMQGHPAPGYLPGYGFYPPYATPATPMPMQPVGAAAQPAATSPDLTSHAFHQKMKKLKQEHQKQQEQHKRNYEKELAELKRRYEQRLLSVTNQYESSLEEVTQQINNLRVKLEALLSQKKSLQDVNEAQKVQIQSLQDKLDFTRKQFEEKERTGVETITRKYETKHQLKLKQERQKWGDQLEQKEAEIVYRHELVKQLRKDITHLRRDKIRLLNSGAEDFFKKLESIGISFIAFHPGVGHMSIPLDDMVAYVENPMAYVADRCLVSEDRYRVWLAHYEKPVCMFAAKENELCNTPIKRVDVPNQFEPNMSDRCDKHKSMYVQNGDSIINSQVSAAEKAK